jgi:hypothetical protein
MAGSITPAVLSLVLAASCLISQARAADAERSSATRVWDSAADFDTCYRDRHLDSLSEPGSVKLVNRVLVADEMGAGYNDFQEIAGKTQARKILVLEDTRVEDAVLLVDGSVKDCDIIINGTVLGTPPLQKTYWDSNFESYAVPPRLLKTAANTIDFRAHGDQGAGRIRVERSSQPNRSAVSLDGGKSWDYDGFCEAGYIDGELGVRLSLTGYALRAWITSPVMDLSVAALRDGLPAGENVRLDALTVDGVTAKDSALEVSVRTGATPDGNAANWDSWQPWQPGSASPRFERFAQWRIALKSTSAAATPIVRRVEARFSAQPVANFGPFKSIKIAEDANQHIVRSSYDFAYANYNGNSRILRDRWKLESVSAPGTSEIERFKTLRQWTRNQWLNGWDHGALKYIPSWDARIILSLAPQNLSLGMCTHYATTFVQCAQALGFPARSVFRGHALSEIWSNDYKKWIVMDAGMDSNDKRRATYNFERDGVPLGELEVQMAALDPVKWAGIRAVATNMSEGTAQVEPPFVSTPLKQDIVRVNGLPPQMFMPLRNNFVDHREPEEPEHGEGYFKFLGHLYWKSRGTPDIRWTDFFTTRQGDINWTLNQAELYPRLAAGQDGVIDLMIDTVTPNFAGYEVRLDDGNWVAWPGSKGSAPSALNKAVSFPGKPTGNCASFAWKLHPGVNTVEVRPFNTAGLRGISSRMALTAS